MGKLLVCGDSGELHRIVVDHLEELGHFVEATQEATLFARASDWDAIVVCHQSFDESLSLCRGLRRRGVGAIMIVIEAHPDYPHARQHTPMDANGSNDAAATAHCLLHGELSLDLLRHRAAIGSKEIELTPIQFRLLSYLLANRGRPIGRTELRVHVFKTSEL